MSVVLLDTTVASLLHPKKKADTRRAKYEPHMRGQTLSLSFQSVAELWDWAEVNHWGDKARTGLDAFIRRFLVIPYDFELAKVWARVMEAARAGLRAFTKYEKVEYANGEEVPAARFLTEVETVVLDSILGRLSKEVGGNGGRTSLAGVDPATRFYTLWRYTYRSAELDAGEAIIFANGTHVELDGQHGMSSGARALVEKKKGKYRLRDFTERGDEEKLGLPNEDGQPAPLIDALHRTLWLMEHRPTELSDFLHEAQPNREQMRVVAQALAGPALKGGELADISPTGELSALAKLTANWRSVVDANVFTPSAQADKKRGQKRIFE